MTSTVNITQQRLLAQAIRKLHRRYGSHILFTGRQLVLHPRLFRLPPPLSSTNRQTSGH